MTASLWGFADKNSHSSSYSDYVCRTYALFRKVDFLNDLAIFKWAFKYSKIDFDVIKYKDDLRRYLRLNSEILLSVIIIAFFNRKVKWNRVVRNVWSKQIVQSPTFRQGERRKHIAFQAKSIDVLRSMKNIVSTWTSGERLTAKINEYSVTEARTSERRENNSVRAREIISDDDIGTPWDQRH